MGEHVDLLVHPKRVHRIDVRTLGKGADVKWLIRAQKHLIKRGIVDGA